MACPLSACPHQRARHKGHMESHQTQTAPSGPCVRGSAAEHGQGHGPQMMHLFNLQDQASPPELIVEGCAADDGKGGHDVIRSGPHSCPQRLRQRPGNPPASLSACLLQAGHNLLAVGSQTLWGQAVSLQHRQERLGRTAGQVWKTVGVKSVAGPVALCRLTQAAGNAEAPMAPGCRLRDNLISTLPAQTPCGACTFRLGTREECGAEVSACSIQKTKHLAVLRAQRLCQEQHRNLHLSGQHRE